MKKIKTYLPFLLIIFSFMLGGRVSALSGATYIDKAYLEGIYTCWTGHLKSAPITTGDFPVFPRDNASKGIFKDRNDGVVLLPTDLTGIYDNNLRCTELIAGYGPSMQGGVFEGLLSMASIKQPNNGSKPSEKTQFMKNIGYSVKKITNEDGQCASVNFKRLKDGDSVRSGTLCLTNLKDNSKITSNTKVELSDDAKGNEFSFQDSIKFEKVDNGGGVKVSYTTYHENCKQTNLGKTCDYIEEKTSTVFRVSDYTEFEDFIQAIGEQFSGKPPSLCAGGYAQQRVCFEYGIVFNGAYNDSPAGDTLVQYVVGNKTKAANTAIKYFSGSEDLKNWASLKYTNSEKVLLYQDYLTKVYEVSFADKSCPDVDSSQEALLKKAGYEKVRWDGSKTCFIKASNTNKEVIGIETSGSKKGHFGKKINFQSLKNELDSITLTKEEIDKLGSSKNANTSGSQSEPTCMNSGGAESLGWIICPVLDWLGNAAENVYDKAVKPALQIEPKLFRDNGGTAQAWSTFQAMANVLFIILLLVVIFSQLTGVGIDNYGIKKILPKLIVAAILINLSYVICVICVDLSNILGNGLQELFNGLPTGSIAPDLQDTVKDGGAGATITSVLLIGGLLGGTALVVWKNPAVVLTLLVGALGVLIAILFVFLLLAGREAAIIVLTVISPVAIACYMLPNTKKAFDKWLKFWEALLLLYPICGALIGGGNFVSKLLLSAGIARNNFWGALTAMIVGIIPIFFIPTLLKGAFAAMGAISSKITGFGDRMRSGATKNIRNSESYKNLQRRGLETGIRRKAGYDRYGERKNLNGFQRLIRGGRRNVQRNALAYQKIRAEKGALEATEGSDFMLETETANEAKRIVANGEINRIGAVGTAGSLTDGLHKALMSGDRAKIRAYTDALSAKGEDGRAAVRSAYDRAFASGMSGAAATAFADNIMAKHAAEYKNNNRSMFEVAKNINLGRGAQSTTAYVSSPLNQAKLADSVTATTIGNMDDGAFEETFGGYNGKAVVIPMGANRVEVGHAAYDALNDQNADIKGARRAYLQQIVRISGYKPPVPRVKVVP